MSNTEPLIQPEDALLVLIFDYHVSIQRLAAGAAEIASGTFREIGGIDTESANRFVEAVVPSIADIQEEVSDITRNYITDFYVAVNGVSFPPPQVRIGNYRPTPPETVYKRPYVVSRTRISQGATFTDAFNAGADRAGLIADTDVMLAHRRSARDTMGAFDGIVGYRRVPNLGACPFCIRASTQRYKTDNLMPLHPRCRCGIAPIIGQTDPGRNINERFFDDLSEEERAAYRKPVKVTQHPDLGPVIDGQ